MKSELDKILFSMSVLLIVVVSIPLALAPDQAADFVTDLYDWIAS